MAVFVVFGFATGVTMGLLVCLLAFFVLFATPTPLLHRVKVRVKA